MSRGFKWAEGISETGTFQNWLIESKCDKDEERKERRKPTNWKWCKSIHFKSMQKLHLVTICCKGNRSKVYHANIVYISDVVNKCFTSAIYLFGTHPTADVQQLAIFNK